MSSHRYVHIADTNTLKLSYRIDDRSSYEDQMMEIRHLILMMLMWGSRLPTLSFRPCVKYLTPTDLEMRLMEIRHLGKGVSRETV